MPNKTGKLSFEVSANLQKLVGEELVTNEEMAVIEIVKNAYDSGAKSVVIKIQPTTSREPGVILIQDDGPGMSLPEFRRIFMFAGYSERDSEIPKRPESPPERKASVDSQQINWAANCSCLPRPAARKKPYTSHLTGLLFAIRKKSLETFASHMNLWKKSNSRRLRTAQSSKSAS